ncbi:MAG: superoxide dismutase, Ni [Candidatus Wildermuthbacteria bacterium RIFCSPHIGHO2_12_FULL_45_9]|uniref:Superoxide dismutase, Ni n=1 Tax=Candidatus Wildermuthbacteria bacterium RIFCSPHIGHO2_02_FULL_45_25 TaxID=1802450 RepID=A0A1G2R173_9BACT|nr:MAG: superoxide dismutase, Ni [Candidatus Wildermuthbacteria bacterium RIFCSPHIGHO2_01_FULL_45_20]OHA66119.1 MAG: superoxide dismutase, Ni [Candidatus Wildermuthbacteria bacterium RIFCSPHIGHO2_02_FULL_45_25]OHA71395.1 MAG: superoxide dismutase, Ni [Candidatus Wildermuthbacteria bacterium RIFCSPHIGHO2_12_FULL_45_9]
MLYKIFSFLRGIGISQVAYAHCDIPCGIYKTEPMQTAAETVVRMVELMTNPVSVDNNDPQAVRNYHNAMARYIMVKEEHAQECKKQVLILWTDFFKHQDVDVIPNLHEKVWGIAKLCSRNKQEINMELAKELKKEVNEFAEIFEKVKAVR